MTNNDQLLPKADQHHHYDHYSATMAARLDGFYGRVDERLNQVVASNVLGTRVLDVGCGFGSLSASLTRHGLEAVGIDLLEECVKAGRHRYPGVDLRVARSEALEFPDKSFDTVVLKDVIHHVYAEDDVSEFLKDIKRVARRRLIVLDPNPTLILLTARRLIGHIDPVCRPTDAIRLLRDAGFCIKIVQYSELIAFPLSGGYVGPVLVPQQPEWIGTSILALDAALMETLRLVKLDRHFGWRYLLVADIVSA